LPTASGAGESNYTGGHAYAIAVMMDGRGMYGQYEATNTLPTLDACGGHYGDVPATTINGVTYPAATNVYHYHYQVGVPFSVGCFGPVNRIDDAKALYSTCNDAGGFASTCTASGYLNQYDLMCPVYNNATVKWNPYTCTADCPCSNATTTTTSAAASGLTSSQQVDVGLGVGLGGVAIVLVVAFVFISAKRAARRAATQGMVKQPAHAGAAV
jgi:hypothetical protein